MSDPAATGFGEGEFITLRIGGDASHPERLLLIGRPMRGAVRVREWTTDTWNTEGTDYEIDPAELLSGIERANEAGLAVSAEMYGIRRWLE